ncbi:hypothetical protein ACHAWF_003750 [Thalassiosira exigua]
MRRISAASSSLLLRRRAGGARSLSAAGRRPASLLAPPKKRPPSAQRLPSSSRVPLCQVHPRPLDGLVGRFSTMAPDWDDGGDDGGGGGGDGGDGGIGGGGDDLPPSSQAQGGGGLLLPTSHSRSLPPPACPPNLLQSEVESIFDAPVGSLIPYDKGVEGASALKPLEVEMRDAYYAADAAVQRAEYLMRGLNARVSGRTFVSRCLECGDVTMEGYLEGEGEERAAKAPSSADAWGEDCMGREDCFRAMLDLIDRMTSEGEAYDEVRKSVRSQLVDPAAVGGDGSSSDSDSSSSSDSDNEAEKVDMDEDGDKSFQEWSEDMDNKMSEAGFTSKDEKAAPLPKLDGEDDEEETSPELYQFGANPGVTTLMYDLVLDALACLCEERFGKESKGVDPDPSVDIVELLPEDAPSPPELARSLLEAALGRHLEDGGDLGQGGPSSDPMSEAGYGVGIGAGTGAGSLAQHGKTTVASRDVRTAPTPLTFNAVLRVAAAFNPDVHAEDAEHARILSGEVASISEDDKRGARERLRDATLDAALSTYVRMADCAALTLRAMDVSETEATSRGARKRRAKLLSDGKTGKRKDQIASGRNAATYTYLVEALTNCIPPSTSRGNIVYGLYHTARVGEGVLDARLARAMRRVGGYTGDEVGVVGDDGKDPPVGNGQLFDKFLQEELGIGVETALARGRELRYDRNYKTRRHVEWDDAY